jgi:hypothetical protein
VFEYDQNGETLSGLLYQVDQNTYMVTLTNGPFEGTRLRFTQETQVEEAPEVAPAPAAEPTQEVASQSQDMQAVSFHF